MHKIRHKPPRLDHVFSSYETPLYFVTMVTWQRQALLNNETAHDSFRAFAERQVTFGSAVGRYVMMPDHMHLFIRIGQTHNLGESIKHLKQAISKTLRRDNVELRIWQPGFFDHLLRHSESYFEKWHYVRNNPVRAGLCATADDWPYQGEIVRIDQV